MTHHHGSPNRRTLHIWSAATAALAARLSNAARGDEATQPDRKLIELFHTYQAQEIRAAEAEAEDAAFIAKRDAKSFEVLERVARQEEEKREAMCAELLAMPAHTILGVLAKLELSFEDIWSFPEEKLCYFDRLTRSAIRDLRQLAGSDLSVTGEQQKPLTAAIR